MRTYIDLLRVPGVLLLTISQVLARIPLGLLYLAILLRIQEAHDSYAVAGAVVACLSIGEAIGTPIASRFTVTHRARGPLLILAALNATCLTVMALVPLSPVAAYGTGLLIGMTVPPIMPVVRSLYRNLVPANSLRAMFALDTTAQELIWVGGPVAAAAMAGLFSTATPLLVAAFLTLVGTVWLCANREIRQIAAAEHEMAFGRIVQNRTVFIALVTSFIMVANFAAVEVGVIAFFEGDALLAGAGLGLSCVGSILGGLLFGHRHVGLLGLSTAITTLAAGTALAGVADSIMVLMAGLFIMGMGLAPALAWLYHTVSVAVDSASMTEAFGWLQTGALVGAAAGTAIGGVMTDKLGADGSFMIGTIFGVIAVAIPLLARATGPIPGLKVPTTKRVGHDPQ